jgi:hypothetical protein
VPTTEFRKSGSGFSVSVRQLASFHFLSPLTPMRTRPLGTPFVTSSGREQKTSSRKASGLTCCPQFLKDTITFGTLPEVAALSYSVGEPDIGPFCKS